MMYTTLAGAGVSLSGCLGDDDDAVPADDSDDVMDDDDDDDADDTDDMDGDDDDDETDDDEPGFEERSDTPLRHAWSRDPPREVNMNPHSVAFQQEMAWPLMARMGSVNRLTGEWYHMDTEGWEVDTDANELRITLKEDLYWQAGDEVVDPVTAEDWVMQEEMNNIHMVPGGEEAIEDDIIVGWHADGDRVFVEEFNPDGANPQIATAGFQWRAIQQYRNGWIRPYYEQLQDATDEDERDEIREEVISENINLLDDEPAVSGPYFVEESTPARTVLRRNPDHWSAEVVNWDIMHLVHFTPEGDPDYQAAVQDDVDIGFGVPEIVDDPPSHIKRVESPMGHTAGECIVMTWSEENDPYMQPDDGVAVERNALIRQAIGHAIDIPTTLLNNFGTRDGQHIAPWEKPFPGDLGRVEREFPELWDAVPSMVDSQPDLAEEKLQRAGLELDGDTWVKSDGDPLTIEAASFSWSREVVDTVVGHLRDVGLNAEHRTTEDSVKFSLLGSGEYQLGQSWTNMEQPLSLRTSDWLVSSWMELSYPDTYEVPPVGEYDASPSETVNAEEIAAEFRTTPEEELHEEIELLLWTCAYHLPMFPLYPLPSSATFNLNHFEWPDVADDSQFAVSSADDDPMWGLPQMWREPRRGVPGLIAKD